MVDTPTAKLLCSSITNFPLLVIPLVDAHAVIKTETVSHKRISICDDLYFPVCA